MDFSERRETWKRTLWAVSEQESFSNSKTSTTFKLYDASASENDSARESTPKRSIKGCEGVMEKENRMTYVLG